LIRVLNLFFVSSDQILEPGTHGSGSMMVCSCHLIRLLNPFFVSSDQVLEPGKGYRFNDGLFRDWQPGTHGSGSMMVCSGTIDQAFESFLCLQ
jgi:hypothetical protein